MTMGETARIRLAEDADVEAMLAIYTPFVRDNAVSFEYDVPSLDVFRERIRATLEAMPWLVCDVDGDVAGYAYASRFRSRIAYQWTVETTVYIDSAYRRCGIARALYTSLFECLRVQGYANAVAVISLPNPASVAFHEALGFVRAGIIPAAGFKHGRWVDVGYWSVPLTPGGGSPEPLLSVGDAARSAEWAAALSKGEGLIDFANQER